MLSIIIITRNEEKYLPRLLKSIQKQNFKDYEIIVADAASTDKTREIAKSFGCKVVKGGLPSVGRNNGVKAAKRDLLIFFDADVVLPKNFLEKNLSEFKKRKVDAATVTLVPNSKRIVDKGFYVFYNNYLRMLEKISPYAVGGCIISTREIFDKINGFDETIKMAEDVDFVNRCSKNGGKFRILKSVPILYDVRRFDREGRVRMAVKYLYLGVYMILFGQTKKSPFKYDLQGVPTDK
ncbi:Glycosyltransferase AglI [uncultured archaeon]|nr:Glycosyltransferase AglI [uncultured archaeon]